MKNKFIIILMMFFPLLLIACSEEQTVEEFFEQEMQRMHDQEEISYELLYSEREMINENDAIGVFIEQYEGGEQFFIVYMEQQDGEWEWRNTNFLEMGTYLKWSDMKQTPYLYAGALSNDAVAGVLVGDIEAEMITTEANHRFWYALNDRRFAEVFYEKEDGTQERVEPNDF